VSKVPRIGRLCVITDTVVQSRYSHDELAALAIEGGADMIQLRDKSMSDREFSDVARQTLEVCRKHDVPLIINDRVEVARDMGADGVHLGLTDTPIVEARASLGPKAIIGGTAATLVDSLSAEVAGATYVGFGHIFPTTSKRKPGPPVGLEILTDICTAVRVPILAIGGIAAENVRACIDAGAHGVAVIAAVCAADDPREAARRIRSQLSA
jgi:thiamine-phosphate pyrophosphorylase